MYNRIAFGVGFSYKIGFSSVSDITSDPIAFFFSYYSDTNSTCGFIGWIDGPMCERSKHTFRIQFRTAIHQLISSHILDRVSADVVFSFVKSKKSKFIFPFDVENESELRFIRWTGQSSFKGRKSKIWRIWTGIPKHLKKFKIKPSDFGNIVSEKV
ncbi:hypothetical protein LXL04_020480 [Taraxacum kok-saghyz]